MIPTVDAKVDREFPLYAIEANNPIAAPIRGLKAERKMATNMKGDRG
jgi:hypothetical protein